MSSPASTLPIVLEANIKLMSSFSRSSCQLNRVKTPQVEFTSIVVLGKCVLVHSCISDLVSQGKPSQPKEMNLSQNGWEYPAQERSSNPNFRKVSLASMYFFCHKVQWIHARIFQIEDRLGGRIQTNQFEKRCSRIQILTKLCYNVIWTSNIKNWP